MATKIETLAAALPAALGDRLQTLTVALGEITAVVAATELPGAMRSLRDRPELRFETLLDLCGVDYSAYAGEPADFADFGSDATPPEHLAGRRAVDGAPFRRPLRARRGPRRIAADAGPA